MKKEGEKVNDKEFKKLMSQLSENELILMKLIIFLFDEKEARVKNWLHDWFISMKGNGLL